VLIDNSAHEFALTHFVRDIGVQRIITMPGNTGYAGGMSRALDYWLTASSAVFGLLLTQDVVLEPGSLGRLRQRLESWPEAGIAGPVIKDSRTMSVFSAGGIQDRRSARVRSLRSVRTRQAYCTDWLDGCALLIRRAVAEQLRTFDARFFMYYEEIDFCERARRRGWTIVLEPSAIALQEKDLLPGAHYFYYTARNRYLFWRKHSGIRWPRVLLSHLADTAGLSWWVLRGMLQPGAVPRFVRLRWLARQLKGMAHGTIDFLRNRFGPLAERPAAAVQPAVPAGSNAHSP
jgi:GT2 family glycosyltransferase